jgi:hypothetical protein
MKEIIRLSVVAVFSILFVILIIGYFVPPRWIFKNRFWLHGTLFGFCIFGLNFNFGSLNQAIELMLELGLSLILGNMIFGTISLWYFLQLRSKTPLLRYSDEEEIASDTAQLTTKKLTVSGRMILTPRRLSFICNNRGKAQYDFYFKDPTSEIMVIYRFGVPFKIKIPNQDITLTVEFPHFWKKEIQHMISHPITSKAQ